MTSWEGKKTLGSQTVLNGADIDGVLWNVGAANLKALDQAMPGKKHAKRLSSENTTLCMTKAQISVNKKHFKSSWKAANCSLFEIGLS